MSYSLPGGSAAPKFSPPSLPAHAPATGITGSIALYTYDGPIPADILEPGDRVITRGSGPAVLRDVRFSDYAGPMVRIAPTTLGRARPETFLLLPPDQRIVLRRAVGAPCDGVFAARALVDGESVKWYEPAAPMRLMHPVFDSPQIVHAGGLELQIDG